MKRRTLLQSLPTAALLPAALWIREQQGSASQASSVYELRIYYAFEGKLDDLLQRFRNHTTKLFEKHGIKKRRLLDASRRATEE